MESTWELYTSCYHGLSGYDSMPSLPWQHAFIAMTACLRCHDSMPCCHDSMPLLPWQHAFVAMTARLCCHDSMLLLLWIHSDRSTCSGNEFAVHWIDIKNLMTSLGWTICTPQNNSKFMPSTITGLDKWTELVDWDWWTDTKNHFYAPQPNSLTHRGAWCIIRATKHSLLPVQTNFDTNY